MVAYQQDVVELVRSLSGQSSRQRSRTVSSEAFRVEAFTKLPKDKLFSEIHERTTTNIVSERINDNDNNSNNNEDDGYQGDKEDDKINKAN